MSLLDLEPIAELLPRWLAVLLGIRKLSPAGTDRPTLANVHAAPTIDTGGGYRPPHRMQDPSVDPREPNGGESSATGSDHGWSGCSMSAGANVLAWHTQGDLALWGGDLRHRQSDLSGGTDLYDVRDAWATYGETLQIRSGQGWEGVTYALEQGRAVLIQGTGEVPGVGSFAGAHACSISPERRSDNDLLFGDPLATGWQWIDPSAIRSWAERLDRGILFAVSAGHSSAPPPPDPDPPDPPPPAGEPPCDCDRAVQDALTLAADQLVGTWVAWIMGGPVDLDPARWDADAWGVGRWARDAVPFPVADALEAISTVPLWDLCDWRQALWS